MQREILANLVSTASGGMIRFESASRSRGSRSLACRSRSGQALPCQPRGFRHSASVENERFLAFFSFFHVFHLVTKNAQWIADAASTACETRLLFSRPAGVWGLRRSYNLLAIDSSPPPTKRLRRNRRSRALDSRITSILGGINHKRRREGEFCAGIQYLEYQASSSSFSEEEEEEEEEATSSVSRR